MIPVKLRTKQDFVKALNQPELKFLEEREIVSDQDIRALTDKIKTLIRNKKRIHISIVERVPSKTSP
jgi:hypothetical protein